jgi:hypothetical protein
VPATPRWPHSTTTIGAFGDRIDWIGKGEQGREELGCPRRHRHIERRGRRGTSSCPGCAFSGAPPAKGGRLGRDLAAAAPPPSPPREGR